MGRTELKPHTDPVRRPRAAPAWQVRSGLALHEVESVLDGLETDGVRQREVQVEADGTFRVRWVPRADPA